MPDSAKQSLTSASSPSPAASSSSASSSSHLRLSQISTQIAPMATTAFDASVVPQAPEDALFGLMAAYRRDTDSNKVDLGIGAYRDNNAKPWVLPVVKKVRPTNGNGSCSLCSAPIWKLLCSAHHMLCAVLLCSALKLLCSPSTTGRRDPPQRPRPQPRVSAHCRAARLHHSLPEACPRR